MTIPVTIADFWLGVNTKWNNPQNWNSGQVPDATTNVIIPANPSGSNFPELIPGEVMHCKGIFIEPGANMHLGQNDYLIIHGN
jgi:hypothetical protein